MSARIARVLAAKGAVQDPAWHRALLAVDRDAFVPHTVWANTGGRYSPVATATDPDVQRWLTEDVSIVTQVDDGRPAGDDGHGLTPTSSISQPSLVIAMLQALDVRDGHSVLEIGTGTGYNTALLCERLGNDAVTSVEVDAAVAETARTVLDGLGYKPDLVVGDGARPAPDSPVDRLISTVAVRDVPPAWLSAVRPGGLIVTPWAPGAGFAESCLLRLSVGHDEASGRVVGPAAFMVARDHRYARIGPDSFVDESDPQARDTRTDTNPRWVSDRTPAWDVVLGHQVPGLGYASYEASDDSGEASVFVFDRSGSGSWALGEYTPEGPDYEARTRGPRDLWSEVGSARAAWEVAGRPGRDRLGLTVSATGTQTLWADEPGRVIGHD